MSRPVRRTSRALRLRALQARKLWHVLREPAYRSAIRHRVIAAVEHDYIPYAEDFRTVVDVGANRGQFALVAMRRFPHAALWCFEPLPEACSKLQALTRSYRNVRVVDAALAGSSDSQTLHVARHDDSSSLHPIGERQQIEFTGTGEAYTLRVRTSRLDELVSRADIITPALLKIDVQGSELEVLVGAEALLDRFDAMLIECSFVELYDGQALAPDVIGHLQLRGWELTGVYNTAHGSDGTALQADFLFARRRVPAASAGGNAPPHSASAADRNPDASLVP